MSSGIRKKLLAALLFTNVAFTVFIGLIVVYNRSVYYNAEKKAGLLLDEMTMVSDSEHAIERALMPGNDYIISGDISYKNEFIKEMDRVDRLLSGLEQALSVIEENKIREAGEEREILAKTRVAWMNIQELSLKIFALPRPIGNGAAKILMEEMDYKWGHPATRLLARWHDKNTDELERVINEAKAAWVRSWYIIGAAFLAFITWGVIFASYYSKRFVRSIEELYNGADRLAGGELDYRVSVKTGDELEQLAGQFNRMGERLKESYAALEERVHARTRELQYERDKLVSVFSAMKDGVFIINKHYGLEYVNPSLEREFGQWQGRRCCEYFCETDAACSWCPIKDVFKGKDVRREWYCVKNAKTYDVLDSPIINSDGSISMLEILRDVSDTVRAQQALAESEEKYRLMIEGSNDLIWVQDPSGALLFMNRHSIEASGFSLDEVKGLMTCNYIVEEDRANAKDAFEKVISGKSVSYEARFLRKDGSVRSLSINAAPAITDGVVVGVFNFGRDVTEERRVTAELNERIDELERFMKVAVEREFRIRELLSELERLKAGK
ncbi:MAG: hypothetical protein A3J24_07475 [Deltaproteobacteria bacterium RIFCSPLOWO2_02_FULL_53_8]|nr:MAG: hypothetical protein A3J24_07475 [Deltaproteobacteria bacterium RIFCSPLOWO2_02_FULL_53_8]